MKYYFKFTLLLYLIATSCNLLAGVIPDINTLRNSGYIYLSTPVKFNTLDPSLSLNIHSKLSLELVFETLIRVNSEQNIEPVLAKYWKVSPENQTVTFILNKGHYFADGTEVTAYDVQRSFQRQCNKNNTNRYEFESIKNCISFKNGLSNLGVNVIDKYTVKFSYSGTIINFLYLLASPNAVILKEQAGKLIGSGDHSVEYNNHDCIILKKNPISSMSRPAPNNPGLILCQGDETNIDDVLSTKKPDGLLWYRMISISNKYDDKKFKLIKSNSNITGTLVLNNTRFPLNQKIVRKALLAKIYNSDSLQNCLHNSRKAYGLIPVGLGGSIYNTAPEKIGQISREDVFKAVPQLKNNGATIEIHYISTFENKCMNEVIKASANYYNINVNFVKHYNYLDLISLYPTKKLDAFIELFVFKNREANSVLKYFTKSGRDFAAISTNKLDEIVDSSNTELSPHKRYMAYREAATYIQDQAYIIPLYYMQHGNLVNHCIQGISEDFYFNPFLYLKYLNKKNCNK